METREGDSGSYSIITIYRLALGAVTKLLFLRYLSQRTTNYNLEGEHAKLGVGGLP